MKNRNLIVIVLLSVMSSMLFSFGQKDKDVENSASIGVAEEKSGKLVPPETIVVSGDIRLVGTALFSELVITDAEGHDWFIRDDEDKQKLSERKNLKVTVRGTPSYVETTLANGVSLGDRRFLQNITVIDE
jgi:hypothetical protein